MGKVRAEIASAGAGPVRVRISRDPNRRRLEELSGKLAKTDRELLEEILLRLRRIEAHLGIK